jgi:hypothetical protein
MAGAGDEKKQREGRVEAGQKARAAQEREGGVGAPPAHGAGCVGNGGCQYAITHESSHYLANELYSDSIRKKTRYGMLELVFIKTPNQFPAEAGGGGGGLIWNRT